MAGYARHSLDPSRWSPSFMVTVLALQQTEGREQRAPKSPQTARERVEGALIFTIIRWMQSARAETLVWRASASVHQSYPSPGDTDVSQLTHPEYLQ